MSRYLAILACITAVRISPLLGQDQLPGALAAARDSLVAGRVDVAIELARRYTQHNPKDVTGFLILGDAYARRTPEGPFRALCAYRAAARLLPRDPEPSF